MSNTSNHTDGEDSRPSHLLSGQRTAVSPDQLLSEHNGFGLSNETLSERTDNMNSLIQTLEPYEQSTRNAAHQLPHRGRGGGGRPVRGRQRHASTNRNDGIENENEWITPSEQRKIANQRRNKQRKLRQLESTYNELESTRMNPYPKFYSLKFPSIEIETKINLIAVDKDIKKQISEPKKIKKLNKDTLLIEVKSDNQGKKLKEVKKVANLEVVIREHQSLNQSQGTVYSEAMSNSSIEELLEALSDQHVIKIERMKKKVNGVLESTHRYIITFNKPDLPRSIKITNWHFELIEVYLPKPMRCVNCQRIGHTKTRCRREVATCSQCGEDGHFSRQCTRTPPKCINCGNEHNAMSNKCPHYIFKSEVLATMTVNKIPFNEATNIVEDRYHEEGKPYSFAVKKNPQTTQNPRSQREPPRREEQNQRQQTQEPPQAIALQEEPIFPSDDQLTQTDRPTRQEPQNITAAIEQAEVPSSPLLRNTQTHNETEQESSAKAQKDEESVQHHTAQMATLKTADDTVVATQSTNKEKNKSRNDKTEKKISSEHKKLTTESNVTKNKTKPTNNKPTEEENLGKAPPQRKTPQEVAQEQLNENANKRSRESTSPKKNDQNKKIKDHNNQIPVLGATGTGIQDLQRGRTKTPYSQQFERDPRIRSSDRRNPNKTWDHHSQNRDNDQGNHPYHNFYEYNNQ